MILFSDLNFHESVKQTPLRPSMLTLRLSISLNTHAKAQAKSVLRYKKKNCVSIVIFNYYLTMIQQVFVCYATPPRRFASRASNFQGFIYDPMVGRLSSVFSEIHPELLFIVITYNCPKRYANMRLFFDCPNVRNTRARHR